jgi:hypothetical protein
LKAIEEGYIRAPKNFLEGADAPFYHYNGKVYLLDPNDSRIFSDGAVQGHKRYYFKQMDPIKFTTVSDYTH